MSNPEHNAKTPSAKTGLFAMLGAFLPGPGRGAPSVGPRRRPRLLLVCLAALTAAALSFVLVAPALAAGPPIVTGGESERETDEYSCESSFQGPITHTSVGGFTGCVNPNGLKATWRFEYATSKEGPWTPVSGDEGSISQVEAQEAAEEKRGHASEIFSEAYPMVQRGNFRISSHGMPLTGLSGETTYYFRLAATNSDGSDFGASTSFETELLRPTPEVKEVFNAAATSARVVGLVEPHGFETHWRYEYATSKEGPWTSGAEGTISQAEVEASEAAKEGSPEVDADLTGLTSGTPYYVRLFAEDEPEPGVHKEATSADRSFETAGPPAATTFPTHALHGEAMRALGFVATDTSLIDEIQTVTVGGGATGGNFVLCLEGACTTATATGAVTSGSSTVGFSSLPVVKGTGNFKEYDSEITGVVTSAGRFLTGHPISGPGIPPGTRIGEVRGTTMQISNQATASVSGAELTSSGGLPFTEGEAISGAGIPTDTTVAHIEYEPGFAAALTLSAKATESGSVPLTVSLPYNASAGTVHDLLKGLAGMIGEGNLDVSGRAGGPYTIVFGGDLAGKEVPQLTADSSGLTPSGTVAVATVEDGSSYATRYDVEYVSQAQFGKPGGEGGFAKAESTPEVDFGGGGSGGETVGVDLPGLQPGETYHFRVTATNTTAGDPVVHGSEQVLTVPVASSQGAEGECPNAQLRSEEASARLPDCRAYEQITPVDKEGAMEPFHYGLELQNEGVLVGEDGDHLMLNEPFTQWGSGTGVALSPYFFSRGSESGWQMTAVTLEPEAGLDKYVSELVSPDLTRLAFSAGWNTGVNASSDIEFKVGSPGGPYVTAASVPREEANHLGWVAASEDFSKLILAARDRGLIPGHRTGTTSGADLYEYSGGELRQVNVTGPSPGVTVGSCGAVIVAGEGEIRENEVSSNEDEMHTGARAVSADGSRVFFEAVPGSDCSEPKHLYMRVNGAETVDLGAVGFLSANKEGTKVLVEKRSGEAEEILLYDTESATAKDLFTLHEDKVGAPVEVLVSEDFNVIYLSSDEHLTPEAPPSKESQGAYLYRYEIGPETLRFLFQKTSAISNVSPDGRYVYIGSGEVAGLPAGGLDPHEVKLKEGGVVAADLDASQAFLYDSAENVIECVSCASPFDPEPTLPAFATGEGSGAGHSLTRDGMPGETMFSANGDFAFFDTPAALVPQDVNGEREPEEPSGENPSPSISVSSDVYEWRRNGIDGCGHVQGCVSLISSGREGFRVLLLGSTESGSDVFFTTRSQLGPNDNDNSLDIYDARVDGGEPPLPPRPVECEGDACSTPFAPPSDLTPSSATFQGAGDVGATSPEAKPKPKPGKKTKKKKAKPKKKGKQGKRAGKKAKKSNDRRGR